MAEPSRAGERLDAERRRLAAVLAGEQDARPRAQAWAELADVLRRQGSRGQALVAVRTALALLEGARAPEELTAPLHERVRALSDGPVVPLTVGAASAPGPGDDRQEARAVWLGAPADPVMAMMGWVERDGALDVLRVVVPGTRRGRAAFTHLLDALPTCVRVAVRLPARDGPVRRACARAGFVEDRATASSGGYLGGSITAVRRPTAPGTDGGGSQA